MLYRPLTIWSCGAGIAGVWMVVAQTAFSGSFRGGGIRDSFFLASNFLFPIGTVMGERLAYAPSLFFCMLLGCGVFTGGRTEPP